MSSEQEVVEYFGYNSILTSNGQRIRRLRRTQLSAEKVSSSKMKSKTNSRDSSTKKSVLDRRTNRSKISFVTTKSKQKNKSSSILKQNNEYISDYASQTDFSKLIQSEKQQTPNSPSNIKQQFGEYYMGLDLVSQAKEPVKKKQKKSTKLISAGNLPDTNIQSSTYTPKSIQSSQNVIPTTLAPVHLKNEGANIRGSSRGQQSKLQYSNIKSEHSQFKTNDIKQKRQNLKNKSRMKLDKHSSKSNSNLSQTKRLQTYKQKKLKDVNKQSSLKYSSKIQNKLKSKIGGLTLKSNKNLHNEDALMKSQLSHCKSSSMQQISNLTNLQEVNNDYGQLPVQKQDEKMKLKSKLQEKIKNLNQSVEEKQQINQFQLDDYENQSKCKKISFKKSKLINSLLKLNKSSSLEEKKETTQANMIKSNQEFQMKSQDYSQNMAEISKAELSESKFSSIVQQNQSLEEQRGSENSQQEVSIQKELNRLEEVNENVQSRKNEEHFGPQQIAIREQINNMKVTYQGIEIHQQNKDEPEIESIEPFKINNKTNKKLKESPHAYNEGSDTSTSQQVDKIASHNHHSIDYFKNLPLNSTFNHQMPFVQTPQKSIPLMIIKKPSVVLTFEQILQNIQEHELRIGFLYLFIDNTKSFYPQPHQFQKCQRLCYLLLKKYLFEKNTLIKTLKGGSNCLNLSEAQVSEKALKPYLQTKEVKERLNIYVDQSKQIFREMEDQYRKIHKKYSKDKFISLESPYDNFSKEIMRLLMQELTKLYKNLQEEEEDSINQTEQRIIEIIEIMFLISELKGRKVKPCDLLQKSEIDFDDYYDEHYQKIIETMEYFANLPG